MDNSKKILDKIQFYHGSYPHYNIIVVVKNRKLILGRDSQNLLAPHTSYQTPVTSYILLATLSYEVPPNTRIPDYRLPLYIFLLYCPPTSNNAFVISPSEHTFVASMSSEK